MVTLNVIRSKFAWYVINHPQWMPYLNKLGDGRLFETVVKNNAAWHIITNSGCTVWEQLLDLPTTMVALSGMAVCLKQLYLPISCMFIFAAWSTWSTHNNGCTDAKKSFSSKFSFQPPAWDNLTRFIHLFQSTLFNIHKCILTFEAISTLPIQFHVLVALKPRSPRR